MPFILVWFCVKIRITRNKVYTRISYGSVSELKKNATDVDA